MKILTIGGATQDIFLNYTGTDFMTLIKKDTSINYLLFESGEKIDIDNITYLTGGGSTNTAVSFNRLGFNTSCFCNLGTDEAGKTILTMLTKNNINTGLITKTNTLHTGTSFMIKSLSSERTIFAYRGANILLGNTQIPLEQIKNYDHLYITSLSNDAAYILPDIAQHAHKNNVPVAINPGSSQLKKGIKTLKEALPYIDIFILNYSEAKTFMLTLAETDDTYKKAFAFSPKTRACPIDLSLEPSCHERKPYLIDNPIACENLSFSIRQFFKEMLKMGPKIIVVTNGSNGVYVATQEEILFHPSLPISVIDTVGAGDSFGSCFVASILLKYSLKDALKNGISNSANVLQYLGAKKGLLTHDELKKHTQNIDPKLLQTFKL